MTRHAASAASAAAAAAVATGNRTTSDHVASVDTSEPLYASVPDGTSILDTGFPYKTALDAYLQRTIGPAAVDGEVVDGAALAPLSDAEFAQVPPPPPMCTIPALSVPISHLRRSFPCRPLSCLPCRVPVQVLAEAKAQHTRRATASAQAQAQAQAHGNQRGGDNNNGLEAGDVARLCMQVGAVYMSVD